MFEKIIEKIEQFDSIVIFGHLNPDGDCYGSAIALKETLKLKYPKKKIYAVGSGCPEFFEFIKPLDKVSERVISKSLALLVDANDIPRMEDQRIRKAADFAKIDHHVDIGSFTEGPSVVDEDANSTCELIYILIKELGLDISPLVANALYLGIVTDTGHFQFVNDFPKTFKTVSEICSKGADPKSIDALLNLREERLLKVKGYFLTHYKKSKGGAIYIIFRNNTIKKLKTSNSEISSLVNLIGNVIGYPVWASFVEYENGQSRLELRSNGPNVQPIARRVGGGGHIHAAGATLPSLDEKLINSIIEDIDNEISLWRK